MGHSLSDQTASLSTSTYQGFVLTVRRTSRYEVEYEARFDGDSRMLAVGWDASGAVSIAEALDRMKHSVDTWLSRQAARRSRTTVTTSSF